MCARVNDPLYLCLDQGGHASRALVFDAHGRQRYHARQPLVAQQTARGWIEYPAETLLDSLRACLDDILQQLGTQRQRLTAAALATQRSNIVCWDHDSGAALSPVISWQDTRHADWLRQFEPRAARIHELTGLPLSPHYGASKLRWCLDNLPAVQQAQREGRLRLGPMAAWLAGRLTREGEARADPVNASRTQLWSLQDHDWHPELLELFGIPGELLPPCLPNLSDYGRLVAGELELPLALVNGDQSAALYAYGPLREDTAYLNLGTGAFVSRPVGQRPLFDDCLLSSVVLQGPHQSSYVLEGTVNGAGAALDWLARQHGQEELAPAQLGKWLQSEYASLPLFLNGVAGLAAPYWRADFESRFIGDGDLPQQAVAVLESIVFLLQTNLQRMARHRPAPRRLQITGGLSHLDDLCQRLADLTGQPVHRPADCEATARGSAFLIAGQPDNWPEPGRGREFSPTRNTSLQERYHSWQDAMDTALAAQGLGASI
ncbi:FGGY family carbohydrate kinase [Thiohalophilus sp.]|uniref:FGGY family carbohydrate kinase n=1 Tax=Thiohalophilus sp. TaxID=3028392 RepID=UPI002ACE3CF0|nr:FGGY family carbohydrate kinase [Thiohalophilus sp.]MDZ7804054.1 FGGY family carbohydrate kinase [Thiohalophilus sp.]